MSGLRAADWVLQALGHIHALVLGVHVQFVQVPHVAAVCLEDVVML